MGQPKRGKFIICYCGKQRWVYPYEIKEGRGKYCSKDCSNKANASKLSEARKGKNNPRFGKEPWNKGKMYSLPNRQGKNSHAWKGGRTREKYRLRRNSEWRIWRKAVFERDSYVSKISGKKGQLIPHHIKLFSFFEEDRFKVENGITLLETEHKLLHKKSYQLQPNCQNCMNIKMEPIIVNLDLFTYKCYKCNFVKEVSVNAREF